MRGWTSTSRTSVVRRGRWRVYAKTAFIVAWFAASYVLLVFFAASWWQVALCAGSLGLSVAAIGFNIQHDGSHGGFSTTGGSIGRWR